ncbi:hypothetical protein LMG28688_00509 [Paraburkholderia caffeinitolerans]|uniref:Uncharacterized protein n=2 Tax=Burkholderiaceae TaxID=119060 RepID=A0A6J5FGX5_9BURK|nr:hypothetical protein LMG28688_00509 [Paraburkholderia caffeinitolerans]
MLDWHHDENPKYVGRVYDAASGKLIVRRTFHTPVPEITWVDNHLLFQRGGDDEDLVILPPSLQDRVVSAFWQLTR